MNGKKSQLSLFSSANLLKWTYKLTHRIYTIPKRLEVNCSPYFWSFNNPIIRLWQEVIGQ